MAIFEEPTRRFNVAVGTEIPSSPRPPDEKSLELGVKLVIEELKELLNECGYNVGISICRKDKKPRPNTIGVAQEGADLQVVLLGLMQRFGITLGPVYDEVMQANMRKLGGPRREDGKILKPEGWQPPNIAVKLVWQGWKGE